MAEIMDTTPTSTVEEAKKAEELSTSVKPIEMEVKAEVNKDGMNGDKAMTEDKEENTQAKEGVLSAESEDAAEKGDSGDAEEKRDSEDAEEKRDSEAEEEKEGDDAEEDTEDGNTTSLEKKIIKQIGFYFGDINLGKDRFLQGKIKEDDGWVTIEVLLTFNRLKVLSEDATVIAESIAKSESGLLEVSEDKLKIRRNPDRPLPEQSKDRRDALKAHSVYAKGFAKEMTREDVEAFFEKHGELDHLQMRTDVSRAFKGSVFVIFHTLEDAQKFVEAESIMYNDVNLMRLLKEDYFKKKIEERKVKKEETLKDCEEKKKDREIEERDAFLSRITKGAVLNLEGLPEGITVDEMRAKFKMQGDVAWIEFQKGDTNARIRFIAEDEAKIVLGKSSAEGKDGIITIKDTEVKATVIEGEDEVEYWKAMFQGQRDRKDRLQLRGGKRGRGGRGYGRGGPPFKKRRTY